MKDLDAASEIEILREYAALKMLLDDQSNLPLARYSGRGGVRAR
jgi:hypothetical protein